MEYKTIFVVTVFEKCEPKGEWYADIGCTRSPCFRYTLKEAEEYRQKKWDERLEF